MTNQVEWGLTMETLNKIEQIKNYVNETLESHEDLSLIAIGNYMNTVFGLIVVDSKVNNEIQIIAESKKYKGLLFEFTADTYQLDSPIGNYIRETVLHLKNISLSDKTLKVNKNYFLTDSNKKKNMEDRYFNESFEELSEVKSKDKEQKFIVDLLKKRLNEMEIQYEYSESVNGEIDTFSMKLKDLKISFGFSNTVQFSYYKNVLVQQLIYRDELQTSIEYELDKILQFIKMYVNNEIILANGKHNISELHDGILDLVGYGDLVSSVFTKGIHSSEQIQRLFTPFAIGDTFEVEFKQMELSIDYDFSKEIFILNVNYLFKETQIEIETVHQLLETIKQLVEIVSEDC